MAGTPAEEGMKTVLLLLCKGVQVYEAAAFHDVLGWPEESGRGPVRVVTVGSEQEVRAAFGMRLIPDMPISQVKARDCDALAVPGGFEAYGFYEDAFSLPGADLIRQFEQAKKLIASICVGALAMVNSGILRGRRATIYHLDSGLRRQQLAAFGAEVVDQPLVIDGKVITSTSPATAMDVALELLTRLAGEEHAEYTPGSMRFARCRGD
jgi:4-methyl-5(b-hydroxyethyl)-thiazole monophosphate biosynthesis